MYHVYVGTRRSLLATDGIGRHRIAILYYTNDLTPVAKTLLASYPSWDFVDAFSDETERLKLRAKPIFHLERGATQPEWNHAT